MDTDKDDVATGDEGELGTLLAHIHTARGGVAWTVAEILAGERGHLPPAILIKLARGEAGGRKSFGRWLGNRTGRWVAGSDGVAYALRRTGAMHQKVVLWAVEVRSK